MSRKRPQKKKPYYYRGKTAAGTHVPVLKRQVMECLAPRPGETVVDCTLGYGGHAREFIKAIGPTGRLIGLEMDGSQLEHTGRRLAKFPATLSLHHRNFAELADVLAEAAPDGVDVIFADLGVSSMQVDDAARGISYKHADAPLDMRMDARRPQTAADLLATLGEEELSAALRELSDEPDHAKIAQFIVAQRTVAPITQTGELARLIFAAKGTTEALWKKTADYEDAHPAQRTFQALRILVNDELGSLRALLAAAPGCLRPEGRIGIISFHGGEDRLVQEAFAAGLAGGDYAAVSDKAVRPTTGEMRRNPRSASGRLRWAQKL